MLKKLALTCAVALLISGNALAASADKNQPEYMDYTRSVDVTPVKHYTKKDFKPEKRPGEVFEVATLSSHDYRADYRLVKYDTIGVLTIGYQNELGERNYTVGPDGKVQLPYVGSVVLEGKTLDEARDIINSAFARYFTNPEISLTMKSYGARKVYVMGEVKSPGMHDMAVDNLNSYAAVSTAGGPTSHGRLSKAQIIRVIDGTMYFRQIDLNSYVKKHDLTQNVVVEDGDIIYVPRTNGVVWQEDVLPVINAFTGIYSVKKLFNND